MLNLKEGVLKYLNIICSIITIFLLSGIIFLILTNKNINKKKEYNIEDVKVKEISISNTQKIKVDIKGAIKKPGVYEIDSNSNVNDLIKFAGGLKKNAITDNINLSRVLEDQMVVKISTKKEFKNSNNKDISECVCPEVEINNCKENSIIKVSGDNINAYYSNEESMKQETDNINSNLISINTASKEQLMALPGIGESKADAILEYRNSNNFRSIEEIKNVSGIGEALYEKIKDHITL